jgi:thiol-disulfide isomerase/thioredoxin
MNSLPPNSAPAEPPAPEAATAKGLGRPASLLLGALALCAVAALFWPHGDGTFKEPGGLLVDAHGRSAKIGAQLAPVSLVHFWATWCPPCIKEAPALRRLAHDFSGRRDFAIVMVAVQDTSEKVRGLLGTGADMVLFDPNWEVAKRYGTDKLPETYLVVRGQVVEKFVGQTDWDNPGMRAKIAGYLSGEDAPARTAGLQ